MSDQFTKVTTQSWGNRLSKSISAIGGGFILVAASIGVLAWNEHRAVETATALSEGASSVLALDEDGYAPDVDDVVPNSAFLNTTGMLVWVSGKLEGDHPADLDLIGPDDAVPENATRLTRVVEMYQWKESQKSETRNKIGGGTETVTTYKYARDWSPKPIDSGNFAEPTGHQNPPFPVEGKTFTEDRELVVGESEWDIAGAKVGSIGTERALPLDQSGAEVIRDILKTSMPLTLSQGAAFFGTDPARPQVGDFRISYKVATADEASIVAADGGSELVPWKSSNGREIFIIREGKVPAAAMFDEEQKANALMTWLIRGGGILAMAAGFSAIFGFLGVIADVIPPLGALVRAGTGVIALALTLVIAPLTIGIAWLAVRPLIGGGVIGIGILLAAGLWYLKGKSKGAAATATSAA